MQFTPVLVGKPYNATGVPTIEGNRFEGLVTSNNELMSALAQFFLDLNRIVRSNPNQSRVHRNNHLPFGITNYSGDVNRLKVFFSATTVFAANFHIGLIRNTDVIILYNPIEYQAAERYQPLKVIWSHQITIPRGSISEQGEAVFLSQDARDWLRLKEVSHTKPEAN